MEVDIIYNEDCLKGMKRLSNDSIDLIATDPPYGIAFMGKSWDKAIPSIDIWREALRVLKPGAFAFVMCIPRQDCLARMIVSLEDAGFKMGFSPIFWCFASGFPKAQNIGKAVDKRNERNWSPKFRDWLKAKLKEADKTQQDLIKYLGNYMAWHYFGNVQTQLPTIEQYNKIKEFLDLDDTWDWLIEKEAAERKIIGERKDFVKRRCKKEPDSLWNNGKNFGSLAFSQKQGILTEPALDQAQALDGSYAGFQPKPAVEVIIVAMKPLSEKTYVDQALKNGKGVTWLDGGRIPYENKDDKNILEAKASKVFSGVKPFGGVKSKGSALRPNDQGRFPSNLLCGSEIDVNLEALIEAKNKL